MIFVCGYGPQPTTGECVALYAILGCGLCCVAPVYLPARGIALASRSLFQRVFRPEKRRQRKEFKRWIDSPHYQRRMDKTGYGETTVTDHIENGPHEKSRRQRFARAVGIGRRNRNVEKTSMGLQVDEEWRNIDIKDDEVKFAVFELAEDAST